MKRINTIGFAILFMVAQLCCTGLHAQALYADTVWTHTYGSFQYEQSNSISQTGDGGFIIANTTNSSLGEVSGNHGSYDCWVVKIDGAGAIQWAKCYGGSDIDLVNEISSCRDGGSIFIGSSKSADGDLSGTGYGDYDAWIVRLDDTGHITWQVRIGGYDADEGISIQQTSDSGFIAAGSTSSSDGSFTGLNGGDDVFAAKLTKTGSISWVKTYGGSGYEQMEKIRQSADGGFIFCANTNSLDSPVTRNYATDSSNDIWAVKLDDTGRIVWQHTYSSLNTDFGSDIIQTADSGYMLLSLVTADSAGDVGPGYGGGGDVWCTKIDSYGDIQWEKTYGGTGIDAPTSIISTTDGGYIFSAYTNSRDGDLNADSAKGIDDYWLVGINDTGAIRWQKVLGGSQADVAYCVIPTRDSGIVVSGYTLSTDGDVHDNHGETDTWVVKLKIRQLLAVNALHKEIGIKVYPTITNGTVYADMPEGYEQANLQLINMNGQAMPVQFDRQGRHCTAYLGNMPEGIYLLQVTNARSANTYKILYQP